MKRNVNYKNEDLVLSVPFVVKKTKSGYTAECQDLNIVTQGKNLKEARKNITEAINLHMKSASELGMIDVFGVKEKDIKNKPFSYWPKGVPSLYTRIRLCLEKLQKNGYVKSMKHGRAWVYHWIVHQEKPIITKVEYRE